MTRQITIKLNYEQFRPLMDKLTAFGGNGITECDSDLAAKALFFCYYFIEHRLPDGKTNLEKVLEISKVEKAEALLHFLNEYYTFKKKGLSGQKKEKKNGNGN